MSELEKEFSEFSEWERELYRETVANLLKQENAYPHHVAETAQRIVVSSRGTTFYRLPAGALDE